MNTSFISSTFSEKSDLVLAQIMAESNLNGSVIVLSLTKLTMSFSRGEISEKQLADSIQKEINASPQIAGQIATKIKNNLIPTLWDKMSKEEKESLLQRKSTSIQQIETLTPKPEEIEKPIKAIKRTGRNIEDASKIPKKIITPERPKTSGPDSYREPIEQ